MTIYGESPHDHSGICRTVSDPPADHDHSLAPATGILAH
jgi:hypothetical protein